MARKQTGQGGQQMGLPTLDWKTCQCGCGKQFLPLKKGRQRKYFDDSHKKRAYRDRIYQRMLISEEAEEYWHGWTDEAITDWIIEAPDSEEAWLGQWELYRRHGQLS